MFCAFVPQWGLKASIMNKVRTTDISTGYYWHIVWCRCFVYSVPLVLEGFKKILSVFGIVLFLGGLTTPQICKILCSQTVNAEASSCCPQAKVTPPPIRMAPDNSACCCEGRIMATYDVPAISRDSEYDPESNFPQLQFDSESKRLFWTIAIQVMGPHQVRGPPSGHSYIWLLNQALIV